MCLGAAPLLQCPGAWLGAMDESTFARVGSVTWPALGRDAEINAFAAYTPAHAGLAGNALAQRRSS